jgi:hypothetical protein
MSRDQRADPDERSDTLGGGRPVARDSFRGRIRRKPGIRHVWRAGVFVVGLLCILGGFALVVLPGPLTIPPIVLGLWIWSTEFEWAHRFFTSAAAKGKDAWEQAKRHPVSSTVVTVGGLVAAGVIIWAALHFDLVARAKDAVGVG